MENTQVGPFLVIKRLGTTRRQHVFHARQIEQKRDVALKFIKVPPDVEWGVALDKIDREVDILKKLQHPNLVQVYGAGVHEEKIFFASELVDGESLAAILARRGKLAPDSVVEYGQQIAKLLEYLHQQDVLHSKLSPEKIIIAKDGTVKITDLRLNRARRRRWDATRRRELDIAAYMAPEQFTEGATHKSDIYSLGVIVYEMLTGKLPYEPDTLGRMTKKKMNSPAPSVATHVMNCPIWLDKISTQMLQPNPRNRPHSARAVGFAFDEIKKIDRSKTAAVDQMTSSFNPLTAGADKTEAKRLLGKKETKRPEDDVPFYTRIPFLVAMLVLIACIAGFAMMPPRPAALLAQAREYMESDKSSDWFTAREPLQAVMKRGTPEQKEEAEELYYESRRRTLVRRAESGEVFAAHDEQIKSFSTAVGLQQDGKYGAASQIYEQLIEEISADSEKRHIRTEAITRLAEVEEQIELPQDPEFLGQMVDDTALATSEAELIAAKNLLSRVVLEFSERSEFANVISQATNNLEIVKRRLMILADAQRGPDPEETEEGTEAADGDDAENDNS